MSTKIGASRQAGISPGLGFTLPLQRVARPGNYQLGTSLQLQDINDFTYLASVVVGGQKFQTILDTGSSDLWIASTSCVSNDCQNIPKYASTPGLALTNVPFELDYLSGSVSGLIGYETVMMGSYLIFSQVLALANNSTNMGLSATGSSGILGLAFPGESSISDSIGRTILDNLFASLDLTMRFFAFKLNTVGSASSFSIGELDPIYADRSSEIDYSPVYASRGRSYDYWKLPLLSITINSISIPFALSPSKIPGSPSPIAVLDTGTSLILGPTHDVDNFWTAAGGAQRGPDGTWLVRCNHLLNVSFLLGNDTLRQGLILDPSDVNWMPESAPPDGWCLGGIQSNDGVGPFRVFSGDWLFGDTFLRNAYVVHQAATPFSPPLIGLLGVTNATEAGARFQQLRGEDTYPSLVHADQLTRAHSSSRTHLIFPISSVSAFLGGALGMVLLRACRDRRWRKLKRRGITRVLME